jgi:hypothetical protein
MQPFSKCTLLVVIYVNNWTTRRLVVYVGYKLTALPIPKCFQVCFMNITLCSFQIPDQITPCNTDSTTSPTILSYDSAQSTSAVTIIPHHDPLPSIPLHPNSPSISAVDTDPDPIATIIPAAKPTNKGK